MIHPITFIEHGKILAIDHKFAALLKEHPKQILWINRGAYTLIPIEIVKKEVSRAKDIDNIQSSNLASLYFNSIDAIEIPKAINVDSHTAIANERLKDAVPFNINYAELECRMLANGAKLVNTDYPKASPTGRFEFKPKVKEDSDFIKHIKKISKFVETWPKWEQDILGVANKSPYDDKLFVLPEHRGYGLPKGKRPLPLHKPIKQSKKYIPDKIYLMCKTGALLVGSYARFILNRVDSYNDFDLIVPPDKWYAVSLLIPKDAKVNHHGGWKFEDDKRHTIDVWPCSIDQHLRQCKPGLGKQEYIVDYINSKVFTAYSVGIKHEA